jgi:hypothetical protein
MIVTSSNNFFIYDNQTKLCLGDFDFIDIIKPSSIYPEYETQIKQILEKDKTRLLDSFSFSKNPNFIAVGSTKLTTIFLIKTDFTSIIPSDEAPSLAGYIKIQNPAAKEYKMSIQMDPLNKYNCVISNNCVLLNNFKSVEEYQIWTPPENDFSIKKEKDISEELKITYSQYVNRHCTKTLKRLVSFCVDTLYLYEVEYNVTTKKHSNAQRLAQVHIPNQARINKIVLSLTNNFVSLLFSKKSLKTFSIDHKKNIFYPKSEMEVINCHVLLF